LDSLPWPQQSRYRQEQFKPWYYTDANRQSKKGGMTKGVDQLQLVSVDNAGHDAPSSQSEACLEVVNKWMAKEKLKLGAASRFR
jgi:carboxypeptidase C (cathepsin A)